MSTEHKPGRPPYPDVLTPAEWRVVELVRHGLTNPAIARRLGVSVDAVKYHVANALLKLGLSGRAELRRWDGVRRDSRLAARPACPGDSLVTCIGQIARTVTDITAATRWYSEVLGLPLLFPAGSMAFFDGGGVRLMLVEGKPAPGESILYFRVTDLHGTYRAMLARGAEGRSSPHLVHRHADGSEEWMAFVNDEEGRPIGLMVRTAPPSMSQE